MKWLRLLHSKGLVLLVVFLLCKSESGCFVIMVVYSTVKKSYPSFLFILLPKREAGAPIYWNICKQTWKYSIYVNVEVGVLGKPLWRGGGGSIQECLYCTGSVRFFFLILTKWRHLIRCFPGRSKSDFKFLCNFINLVEIGLKYSLNPWQSLLCFTDDCWHSLLYLSWTS